MKYKKQKQTIFPDCYRRWLPAIALMIQTKQRNADKSFEIDLLSDVTLHYMFARQCRLNVSREIPYLIRRQASYQLSINIHTKANKCFDGRFTTVSSNKLQLQQTLFHMHTISHISRPTSAKWSKFSNCRNESKLISRKET